MAQDKYKIDPYLLTGIRQSKQNNAFSAIGKTISQLGQNQEDRQTAEDKKLLADEELKSLQNTNKISAKQYETVKDTIDDEKAYMNFVRSGKSLEQWLEDGGAFKTSKYYDNAKVFGDEKISLLNDKDIKYHTAQANRLFMKDGTFQEDEFYNYMDRKLKDKEINKDVYSAVIDGVNKSRKGGIYKASEKTMSISEQIKINDRNKENENNIKLEKDLVDIRANYKKLFGMDMTTAQEIQYKKNGTLPYMVYGTKNLKDQRKKLIDANIEIEKALSELDKYTFEEIDEVAGRWTGHTWQHTIKDAVGNQTPRQKEILAILGHINSDKMHELYGSALTGGEVGRSKTWNLDTGQSTKSLLTAINKLRAKNTIQFKNNTHGVHGVPMKGMTFGQFKIPSEDTKVTTKNNTTPTKVTAQQAQNMGITFK